MHLTKIAHVITVLFVLFCAMVCPLPQVLCAGFLDFDLEHCLKKRHCKHEFGFYFISFLQKMFHQIIPATGCLFNLPLFSPLRTIPAQCPSSLSSTILLL